MLIVSGIIEFDPEDHDAAAELFRPLVADSAVLVALNNGEVAPKHALFRAGAAALTPAGRHAIITTFERQLAQEITHPVFGYRISYRRLFEVQARLLDASGRLLASPRIELGYVLAGAELPMTLPVAAAVCRDARRLELLPAEGATIALELPAAGRRCVP